MMSQYGVEAHFDEESYHIEADSSYNAIEYQIEPDVSAACYFLQWLQLVHLHLKYYILAKILCREILSF